KPLSAPAHSTMNVEKKIRTPIDAPGIAPKRFRKYRKPSVPASIRKNAFAHSSQEGRRSKPTRIIPQTYQKMKSLNIRFSHTKNSPLDNFLIQRLYRSYVEI